MNINKFFPFDQVQNICLSNSTLCNKYLVHYSFTLSELKKLSDCLLKHHFELLLKNVNISPYDLAIILINRIEVLFIKYIKNY